MKPSLSRPSKKAGFALIITVVLLSFLVLLLVSLASLTKIETQVASNSQDMAQARQNALMGLTIALGQLQQAAGPDQCITARAEILDSDATTLAIDGVSQPYLTGVWATGNASLDTQRQTTFRSLTPPYRRSKGEISHVADLHAHSYHHLRPDHWKT